MVKAHSKDDICYYASLLLAQFEGPEEWSHTTPLPLYQTPHGSPVWSAFRFPSHIPRFHVISVEMADSHILP